MTSFRNDVNETAKFGCLTWIFVGMLFLTVVTLGLVATGVNLTMLPFVRQQETQINRSSQGYIETRQAVLLKITQDAFRLSVEIDQGRAKGEDVRSREAELKASLDAIEREASTIDQQYIPAQTRDLMARHGRAL